MTIVPEEIPDEVVEGMMQPLAYPMGTLPSTVSKMRLAAALNAWPKMFVNAPMSVPYHQIILPLPVKMMCKDDVL
jgi:hypothetical protein